MDWSIRLRKVFSGSSMARFLAYLTALSLFAAAHAQKQPITVRVGDRLAVMVVGFEEFTGEYQVLTDGSISGAGFGRIIVEGKTLSDAETQIAARLRDYVRNPQVTVVMRQQAPRYVYVIGGAAPASPGAPGEPTAMKGPGLVPWTPELDMQKLVAAVGFAGPAEDFEIKLLRKGRESIVAARGLLSGDPAQNLALLPDDVVSILPVQTIRVWVVGSVARPGEIRVKQGVDAYQAIALAGGIQLPPGGLLDDIEVTLRRGDDSRRLPTRPAFGDPQPLLAPGDTVYVQPPRELLVTIAGEVVQPGEFSVRSGTSVGAAIAKARGVTPAGTLSTVYVSRGGQVLRVNATMGENGNGAFALEANDLVYVPKNERAIFVLGEVRRPGKTLIPDEKEMRVSDALAAAEGLSDRGTMRRVVLMRADAGGKYKPLTLNLDEFLKDGRIAANPLLQPGDVLLFGQPKGMNMQSITQILPSILLFDNFIRR